MEIQTAVEEEVTTLQTKIYILALLLYCLNICEALVYSFINVNIITSMIINKVVLQIIYISYKQNHSVNSEQYCLPVNVSTLA